MSKRKTKKVVLVALAVIVGLTVASFATSIVINLHKSDRISSRYSTIHIPSSLYLSQKKYNGRSFGDDSPGVNDSWTYTYLPVSKNATLQEIHDSLESNIRSAGYSIESDANLDPDQNLSTLHATSNDVNLIVDINADTTSDGQYIPTSIVQNVVVKAYD